VIVQLNGEPREVSDHTSLAALLDLLNFRAERVAIELNHEVVRRVDWPNTVLQEGDKVEIVHFVGGGS
jgi:thiamine biosynthesis protein ThiS